IELVEPARVRLLPHHTYLLRECPAAHRPRVHNHRCRRHRSVSAPARTGRLPVIGEFVSDTNRYLEVTAPWGLAKRGDADRLGVVLQHAVEAARLAARLSEPI